MPERHPHDDRLASGPQARNTVPGSPHAEQLARGFPGLKFEPPLEREFREVHHARVALEVRRNLWLGIAFVVCFSALGHFLASDGGSDGAELLRMLPFLPFLLIALVIAYTPLYRFYPLTAQIGAPLFGAGVALLEVLGALRGAGMVSTVVVSTFYIYLMLGLRFYPALRSASLILAVHSSAALTVGLPTSYLLSSAVILAFTNIIGATVCYRLEHANRTNYLEARLLTEAASRDGLTGIHNRRLFDEHIDRVWQQAMRDRVGLALLLIDIDHFKAFNDYYGHQAGDECLRQVAACLAGCARRPLDIAARYGGEEFAVVLYDANRSHIEDAARRVQAGIDALAIRHAASPASVKRLTVSIGSSCVVPLPGRSHFGFIQLADEALYEAKERGRNRLVVMDKAYAEISTGPFRRAAQAG